MRQVFLDNDKDITGEVYVKDVNYGVDVGNEQPISVVEDKRPIGMVVHKGNQWYILSEYPQFRHTFENFEKLYKAYPQFEFVYHINSNNYTIREYINTVIPDIINDIPIEVFVDRVHIGPIIKSNNGFAMPALDDDTYLLRKDLCEALCEEFNATFFIGD